MENGPVEIVDFPIKNGGSFHSKMLVHQRVGLFSMLGISGESVPLVAPHLLSPPTGLVRRDADRPHAGHT